MSTLQQTFEKTISDLRLDRNIFDKFEIPDKYILDGNTKQIISKVFDYWYDRIVALEKTVDKLDRIESEFKSDIEKIFANGYNGIMKLTKVLEKHTDFSILDYRANIKILSNAFEGVVLFKPKDATKEPEDIVEYDAFLRDLYNLEQECNKAYAPLSFAFHAIYYDDEINIESISTDFPIQVKIPH